MPRERQTGQLSAAALGRVRRLWAIISVIVLAAVLGISLAGFVYGWRLYDVMTPSMGQTAPVGSLLVVHPAPTYHVGEFVSFHMDDHVISHRLVAEHDGVFTTKGDLNTATDAWRVHPSQIIGIVDWHAPGLGMLLSALPWIALGALITEIICRLPLFRKRWKIGLRFVGWSVTFTLVGLWLRPWFNIALIDYRANNHGIGVVMHVVNTGLFPLLAGSRRIVSGQSALVAVQHKASSGGYLLRPTPDLPFWGVVIIVALCLLPLATSLIHHVVRYRPAGNHSTEVVTTEPRLGSVFRSTLSTVGMLSLIAITLIAVILTVPTHSALAATIANSTNSSGTNPFFTCDNAETTTTTTNPIQQPTNAYALAGTSTQTGSMYFYSYGLFSGQNDPYVEPNLDGPSNTAVNAIGIWQNDPVTSNSSGCQRDTPASVTFDGSSQCLYLTNNFSTEQGGLFNLYTIAVNPPANAPNTFSVEVWFEAPAGSINSNGSGRIIGFTNSTYNNTSAIPADDRNIYLDESGQIVFGTYNSSVSNFNLISTPAQGQPGYHDYADGQWHQVVATLSSQGMYLYADGNLVASNTSITQGQSFSGWWDVGCGYMHGWDVASVNGNTYTSGQGQPPSYFTGQMQYIAIYNNALNAQTVMEHYRAGLSGQ